MTGANGAVVRTRGLTKSYGTKRGIVDVDLEVHAGEIFGYLGPHGSGQATTLPPLPGPTRPRAPGRGVGGGPRGPHAGEIFGYLGPNGSGKSTTIRLLLDLIRPTRGTAEVLGHDARDAPLELKRQIGFLPR